MISSSPCIVPVFYKFFSSDCFGSVFHFEECFFFFFTNDNWSLSIHSYLRVKHQKADYKLCGIQLINWWEGSGGISPFPTWEVSACLLSFRELRWEGADGLPEYSISLPTALLWASCSQVLLLSGSLWLCWGAEA